jgi:superfamily II DNA or RNA helicase
MPTGSGKTITALEYVKLAIGEDKNMIAAVVVPTLDIKRMWERKIEELMMERVTVINYQSLNAPSIVAAADVIVFDECHHVAAKTLYNLAMKAQSSAIIVGLSATPTREDMQDMKMFGATGPIVYQVSRRELIDAGFLSDARVVYLRPRFDTRGDYTLDYAGTYEKHIVRNDNRNELIITSAEKYVMSGKKVLVLVTQIEHGQEVYNRIISSKKVFCHGTTDERFKDLSQFDVIVASNIFNEGIDLPELDVVILAAGGKSSIQLTQRVGRVLRLKKHQHPAVIVDFVDLGPRHLSAHYKKRRALLEADFEVDDEQSGEIV